MFQQHPEFEQIEDIVILWRYADIPRYLDLLLKRQLFFSRADKFEDPFEGKYNVISCIVIKKFPLVVLQF